MRNTNEPSFKNRKTLDNSEKRLGFVFLFQPNGNMLVMLRRLKLLLQNVIIQHKTMVGGVYSGYNHKAQPLIEGLRGVVAVYV